MGNEKTQKEASKVESLTSLSAFKELVAERLKFRFRLQGKLMEIEYERLSPEKQAEINKVYDWHVGDMRLQSHEVFPPKKGDTHDLGDAEYLRALKQKEIEARALALYEAVPLFRGEGERLTDRKEIVAHIQSLGTDALLTALHSKIVIGDVELADMANFTTGAEQDS